MLTGKEIDLSAAARVVWHNRWLVIACAMGLAAAAAIYSAFATRWYKAVIVVAQVEDQSIGRGVGQLGSLAGLVGINLAGGGSSKIPLAVLRSREFARDFIADSKLADVLQRRAGSGDIRDVTDYFLKHVLSVYEDRKTGMISIGIEWTDPAAAAQWAKSLIDQLNGRLRARALLESERNIEFLRREMTSTSVTSMQQSIGKVLEAEMQKLLLARGSEQFAFQTIDGPEVPKSPSFPRRFILIASGTLAGTLLGVLLAVWRYTMMSRRTGAQVG